MNVTVIPRPTGNADEQQSEHPTITAFNPVASYSWLDASIPTILVPGELLRSPSQHCHQLRTSLSFAI